MQVGQKISGALSSYTIQGQIYRTIYSAISNATNQQVVIKTERVTHQLHNERAILNRFQSTPHIRQLIDEVQDPPALVLNRLDGDISDAAKEKPLRGKDLKIVAKIVLERLRDMHDAGFIHTDVKPRNILVNWREREGKSEGEDTPSGREEETLDQADSGRFSEIQLNDFGDAFPTRSVFDFNIKQPFIGAALWRSPEAILGLRWDASTDVWSFGATLLSLLYGHGNHIFKPTAYDRDDPEYEFQVLVKQLAHFGPWPDSLVETVEDGTRETMQKAWAMVTDKGIQRPFYDLPDMEITSDEKDFLLKMMKLDPRQRPKTGDLLGHTYFGDGRNAGIKGIHTG